MMNTEHSIILYADANDEGQGRYGYDVFTRPDEDDVDPMHVDWVLLAGPTAPEDLDEMLVERGCTLVGQWDPEDDLGGFGAGWSRIVRGWR